MSKVMLVTGSRKGIGKALVDHYATQGLTVYGCSRSAPDEPRDNHFQLDVRDETAVRAMIRTIKKAHGRLDVLLNNAGVASMNHALTTPVETMDHLLGTNTTGAFLLTREAAKLMRKNGWGRVVNFSTIAVPLRLDGHVAYVASKAAVEGMSGVLARDLAPFGITVNTVGPGPVDTDLLRGVPDQSLDALVERQIIQRKSSFDDIAAVVDFFISDRASMVTGQTIYLGGVA